MDLKFNVTSASHNKWFHSNLIYARYCQMSKTYGVIVQRKSCLIYFALTSQWVTKDKQINHDNHHDESKTMTHRFSKLPDDGDPWAPNNLPYSF